MNSIFDTISLVSNRLAREWRFLELRRSGATIGTSVQTYGQFFKGEPRALRLGDCVRLMRGTLLAASETARILTVAKNVYINRNSMIDCRHTISIGYSTIVGPNVYICDFDHGYIMDANDQRPNIGEMGPVYIGANVWLGAGVIVTKNVNIGSGSIVGAGSVVTRCIPEDSLAVGNPARVIGLVSEKFASRAVTIASVDRGVNDGQ